MRSCRSYKVRDQSGSGISCPFRRYCTVQSIMASSVLSVFDLLSIITHNISSRADISSLRRCSRALREATLHFLYQEIEFSIFKVDSLAETLRSNRSLSHYCRKLSLVGKITNDQQVQASRILSDRSGRQNSRTWSKIEQDIVYVMTSCLETGNLSYLSWEMDIDLRGLKEIYKIWESVSFSRQTLRSVRIYSMDENFVYEFLVSLDTNYIIKHT